MRKTLFLTPALAVSIVCADSSSSNLQSRLNIAQEKVSNLKQTNGEVFYGNPAERDCKLGNNALLFGEALYWVPYEEGLSYVSKIEDADTLLLKEKFIEPEHKWRPGFRIGLGAHLMHDEWDLTAIWTSYQYRVINTESAPLTEPRTIIGFANIRSQLIPLFASANSISSLMVNGVTKAKSTWELTFNVVDLILGRPYYLSRRLAITPQGGMKGAIISQNFDWNYFSPTQPAPQGSTLQVDSSAENDYTGLGPQIGMNLDWFIIKNFKFYGQLNGSLLYGRLNTGYITVNQRTTPFFSGVDQEVKEHASKIRSMMQGMLGIAWQSCLGSKDQFFLELGVTYESQIWFNQLALRRLIIQSGGHEDQFYTESGNLNLQGFNFRARFDF